MFFLTGAYGVGKSTLCDWLESHTSIHHLQASALIFDYLGRFPPREKTIKGPRDLDVNQQALLDALQRIDPSSFSLLEGHVCLPDRFGEIYRIPMRVFRSMDLAGIIVVSRDIAEVKDSLSARDDVDYSFAVLTKLQQQELLYTEMISCKLGIPRLHLDLDLLTIDVSCEKIKEFVTSS